MQEMRREEHFKNILEVKMEKKKKKRSRRVYSHLFKTVKHRQNILKFQN